MANLRILMMDGIEYNWSFEKAKTALNQYQNDTDKTKEQIYEDLAERVNLTTGAVKNWFTRKNGPNDIKDVKAVANYLGADVTSFVDRKKSEEERMDEKMMQMMGALWQGGCSFNYDTIRFLAMLEELSKMSEYGFIGFSKYRGEDFEGVIYIDGGGKNQGRIVLDMCVDEIHHDAISFYDGGYIGEISFKAIVEEDDEGFYIYITGEQNMSIVIENGRWYCV